MGGFSPRPYFIYWFGAFFCLVSIVVSTIKSSKKNIPLIVTCLYDIIDLELEFSVNNAYQLNSGGYEVGTGYL